MGKQTANEFIGALLWKSYEGDELEPKQIRHRDTAWGNSEIMLLEGNINREIGGLRRLNDSLDRVLADKILSAAGGRPDPSRAPSVELLDAAAEWIFRSRTGPDADSPAATRAALAAFKDADVTDLKAIDDLHGLLYSGNRKHRVDGAGKDFASSYGGRAVLRERLPDLKRMPNGLAKSEALFSLLVQTHPFGDGNGRIARACAAIVQMQGGFVQPFAKSKEIELNPTGYRQPDNRALEIAHPSIVLVKGLLDVARRLAEGESEALLVRDMARFSRRMASSDTFRWGTGEIEINNACLALLRQVVTRSDRATARSVSQLLRSPNHGSAAATALHVACLGLNPAPGYYRALLDIPALHAPLSALLGELSDKLGAGDPSVEKMQNSLRAVSRRDSPRSDLPAVDRIAADLRNLIYEVRFEANLRESLEKDLRDVGLRLEGSARLPIEERYCEIVRSVLDQQGAGSSRQVTRSELKAEILQKLAASGLKIVDPEAVAQASEATVAEQRQPPPVERSKAAGALSQLFGLMIGLEEANREQQLRRDDERRMRDSEWRAFMARARDDPAKATQRYGSSFQEGRPTAGTSKSKPAPNAVAAGAQSESSHSTTPAFSREPSRRPSISESMIDRDLTALRGQYEREGEGVISQQAAADAVTMRTNAGLPE